MGPRTEPCGMPDSSGTNADLLPPDSGAPISTASVLCVR